MRLPVQEVFLLAFFSGCSSPMKITIRGLPDDTKETQLLALRADDAFYCGDLAVGLVGGADLRPIDTAVLSRRGEPLDLSLDRDIHNIVWAQVFDEEGGLSMSGCADVRPVGTEPTDVEILVESVRTTSNGTQPVPFCLPDAVSYDFGQEESQYPMGWAMLTAAQELICGIEPGSSHTVSLCDSILEAETTSLPPVRTYNLDWGGTLQVGFGPAAVFPLVPWGARPSRSTRFEVQGNPALVLSTPPNVTFGDAEVGRVADSDCVSCEGIAQPCTGDLFIAQTVCFDMGPCTLRVWRPDGSSHTVGLGVASSTSIVTEPEDGWLYVVVDDQVLAPRFGAGGLQVDTVCSVPAGTVELIALPSCFNYGLASLDAAGTLSLPPGAPVQVQPGGLVHVSAACVGESRVPALALGEARLGPTGSPELVYSVASPTARTPYLGLRYPPAFSMSSTGHTVLLLSSLGETRVLADLDSELPVQTFEILHIVEAAQLADLNNDGVDDLVGVIREPSGDGLVLLALGGTNLLDDLLFGLYSGRVPARTVRVWTRDLDGDSVPNIAAQFDSTVELFSESIRQEEYTCLQCSLRDSPNCQ